LQEVEAKVVMVVVGAAEVAAAGLVEVRW